MIWLQQNNKKLELLTKLKCFSFKQWKMLFNFSTLRFIYYFYSAKENLQTFPLERGQNLSVSIRCTKWNKHCTVNWGYNFTNLTIKQSVTHSGNFHWIFTLTLWFSSDDPRCLQVAATITYEWLFKQNTSKQPSAWILAALDKEIPKWKSRWDLLSDAGKAVITHIVLPNL